MRKAVFWDSAILLPRQEAAGTLAMCAYGQWKNYLLGTEPDFLQQEPFLARFFSGELVLPPEGLGGPQFFRAAERAAKFPTLVYLATGEPAALVRALKAGWHGAYLAKPGVPHLGADITALSLAEIGRRLL